MHYENLWAPWRLAYIKQLETQKTTSQSPGVSDPTPTKPICFLCEASEHVEGTPESLSRLVLWSNEHGTVLMNRYPYITGHLLVAPREHVSDLSDLTAANRAGLMELISASEQLLRDTLNPQGFNIGMNIGRAAGAGVPGHLHVHVIPRWAGDVNFMDVVGDVRVIPGALEEIYEHLQKTLQKSRTAQK